VPPTAGAAPREPVTAGDATAGMSRWTVAAAGTRTAAKWMIGSLAAAAALIFGAGPIVNRPELSWSDNGPQLLIAMAAGSVGLVSLILLIGQIAAVLTPVKVSLETLPAELLHDLDTTPVVRLPSGSSSYAEFLQKYKAYKAVVATLSITLAHLDGGAPHASTQRTQLTKLLNEAKRNVEVYERAADGFLNQAEFYGVSSLFSQRRGLALTLATTAAIGALGFQLALATGPKDSPKESELAYVVAPSGGNELWNALDLGACAVGTKVPVLVAGGKGSDDEPYAVTVLKVNDRCTPKSFDLRSDALMLEKIPPGEVTVHYAPKS
jgi:hypothetical protein